MTVSASGAFNDQRAALVPEAILPYWRDLLALGDASGIATSMPRFTVHGPTLVKKSSYKVGLVKSAGKGWVQSAEIRTALDELFPALADPASGAVGGTSRDGSVVEPDALRPPQQTATRDVENDGVSVVVVFHDPGAFGRALKKVETGKLKDGEKPPFPLKPVKSLPNPTPISHPILTPLVLWFEAARRGSVGEVAVGKWPAGATVQSLA